jgi:hypothetical protein
LPAFTDLGTTDFFRIINGGTGNSEAQISGITVTSLAAVPGPIALDCRVCSLPAAACLPSRGVGARPQSWLLPRFSGAFLLGSAVINLCSAERARCGRPIHRAAGTAPVRRIALTQVLARIRGLSQEDVIERAARVKSAVAIKGPARTELAPTSGPATSKLTY